ncbi:hypothetical protein [Lysinibacillus parviboronicapiens]|uniref:Uncharacterized protein n=1 Tax=Lysinibacillus parviboronicapiens TaxID=436516 RepID=A0ABV2PQ13_9BACI|nr:hypothetical protein [Lysinibacillus parviboronicapiens]
MRFLRKNKYLSFFIILFFTQLGGKYYQTQEVYLVSSLGMALWIIVVYAFVDWAWDSKDYTKKQKDISR